MCSMYEKRTLQLFLDDMDNAIHRVLDFIQDMSYEEFLQDVKTQDAVLRNIQVLGDAADCIDNYHDTRGMGTDIRAGTFNTVLQPGLRPLGGTVYHNRPG